MRYDPIRLEDEPLRVVASYVDDALFLANMRPFEPLLGPYRLSCAELAGRLASGESLETDPNLSELKQQAGEELGVDAGQLEEYIEDTVAVLNKLYTGNIPDARALLSARTTVKAVHKKTLGQEFSFPCTGSLS